MRFWNRFRKSKEFMTDISSCFDKSGRVLDIVTIADTHGKAKFDEITDVFQRGTSLPNVVFLLGDIPASDLETILDAHGFINSVPVFGICGNHDPKGLLKSRPGYETIQDLDGKASQLNAVVSIGGLSGSIKYKEDDYYHLITQKESVERLNMLPYVDILLTHDKPCFERPAEEDYNGISAYAHSGLYGIGKYILEKAPKIVLHGHLHEPYLKKVEQTGTIVKCCYGVERFLIYV